MILRYSATHKTQHNKVYRLDALDAYNQKLVKKIAVRGISDEGLSGHQRLPVSGIDRGIDRPSRRRRGWKSRSSSQDGHQARRFASWRKATISSTSPAGWTSTRASSSRTSTPMTNTVSFTNGVEIRARRGHRRRERNALCAASRFARPSKPTSKKSKRCSTRASKCCRCSSSMKWPNTAQYNDAGEKPASTPGYSKKNTPARELKRVRRSGPARPTPST